MDSNLPSMTHRFRGKSRSSYTRNLAPRHMASSLKPKPLVAPRFRFKAMQDLSHHLYAAPTGDIALSTNQHPLHSRLDLPAVTQDTVNRGNGLIAARSQIIYSTPTRQIREAPQLVETQKCGVAAEGTVPGSSESNFSSDFDDLLEDLGHSIGMDSFRHPRLRRASFDRRRRNRSHSPSSDYSDSDSDESYLDSDSEGVEKSLELGSNHETCTSTRHARRTSKNLPSDDEVLAFLPPTKKTAADADKKYLNCASMGSGPGPSGSSRLQNSYSMPGATPGNQRIAGTEQTISRNPTTLTTTPRPTADIRLQSGYYASQIYDAPLLACNVGRHHPSLLFTPQQVQMIIGAHATSVPNGERSQPCVLFPTYLPMPAIGPTIPKLETWSDICAEREMIEKDLKVLEKESNVESL
ncbi:hypothetical protein NLI96_g11498 [Meripilus lineatus]|uniref:Uncharacterized protein n=1 Tax=Meripilus lineatus TaxID=2056292 RepID=A0AAD5URN5_9APHY|nr:hypothetical protein NLI96_g11498 [Physisporinus lineatus]